MKKFINHFTFIPLVALSFSPFFGWTQHQELGEKPSLWKSKTKQGYDSTSLRHAFTHGVIHGHLRYFFMHTNNAPGLSDYYAHAIGGGIKYETAPFKGFQFGVSGFYVFNIASSDLEKADEKTNAMNRYEIGLFDVQDPSNKHNIDRLEELYLKYTWKKNQITYGKQLINTPFINLQDGRMRPSEVQGLYLELNSLRQTHIEGGFLHAFSPRSTTDWFSTGRSIGIYASGVTESGEKSDYAGNIKSAGVLLAGIQHQVKDWRLTYWNVNILNVSHTSMIQGDWKKEVSPGLKGTIGLQGIWQTALQDGGNEDKTKTYFNPGSDVFSFGVRVGIEKKQFQSMINYNRITAHGRYLMPREWGRDPFFTFMPRERNEGLGDVHAISIRNSFSLPRKNLRFEWSIGYFDLPDVKTTALNKYGLPSYWQTNLDARYAFRGLLEGLETQFLLVFKKNQGNIYGNERYIINKVDMTNLNLVLNYHF
jgi:hypothetical protein